MASSSRIDYANSHSATAGQVTAAAARPNAARSEQAWQVRTSLGIWTAMLPFLTPMEQQLMQVGDRFSYHSAVGRVVT